MQLGAERIGALPFRLFGGLDGQPLLLGQERQEAADRVRLPGGRLPQFLSSFKVAPPGRFTRFSILAVLLPGRALPAFRRGSAPLLAEQGCADLAWEAARRPLSAARVAFWGGLGVWGRL